MNSLSFHKQPLTYQQVIVGRQTDWYNIVLEFDLFVQLQKGQVVLVGEEVVVGVDYFLGDFAFDVLVRFTSRTEVPFSDSHANL